MKRVCTTGPTANSSRINAPNRCQAMNCLQCRLKQMLMAQMAKKHIVSRLVRNPAGYFTNSIIVATHIMPNTM